MNSHLASFPPANAFLPENRDCISLVMDFLTDKENALFNTIITQCYKGIITDDQCHEIMSRLKRLIPFEHWGIAFIYFNGENVWIEEVSWFRGIEGFEEHYLDNSLFYKDPVAEECLNQVKRGKLEVQFWMDTYRKRPNTDFYKMIEEFPILRYNGYTVQHQINLLQYAGFSITGPNIKRKKDQRIVRLLEAMVPHVASIALNGKLGKLKDLTDKQFQIYQLLKTSLSYKQIAKVMNITPSGVEKAFGVIKKKIGVSNKKGLSFGFHDL